MSVSFNISWYKIILPTDKVCFTDCILLSKNYNIILSPVEMEIFEYHVWTNISIQKKFSIQVAVQSLQYK